MIRFIPTCLLAIGVLAFAACGDGDNEPDATPTPTKPGPQDVVGQWVLENRNVNWVGDCSDAQEGLDVGKMCGTLVGERGTRRAIAFGPTFSEPTTLAILEETPDAWEIIEVTNSDPSTGGIPGIPWPLQEGDRVVVIGLGENDCLRIREQPSQGGNQLTCVPDGTVATVLEGPVEADTFMWWRLGSNDFNGWAAENWLRLESEIARLFNQGAPAEGEGDAGEGDQAEEQ